MNNQISTEDQIEALYSMASRYSGCKYVARKKSLCYLQDKVTEIISPSVERNKILIHLKELLKIK